MKKPELGDERKFIVTEIWSDVYHWAEVDRVSLPDDGVKRVAMSRQDVIALMYDLQALGWAATKASLNEIFGEES